MPKVTLKNSKDEKEVVTVRTQSAKNKADRGYKWWKANSKREMCQQLLATTYFLKNNQQFRQRQAGIHARLYGGMPLSNSMGSTLSKMGTSQNNLPIDRPTMNVVQSCTDTLVSRLTQSRPRPVFLTDNGDYKERNLAKEMNGFIQGEFYQTRAYELGALILRDAAVLGSGCMKVFEGPDNKVGLERVLATELLVDPNESLYGFPRQLYHLKLVDRDVLAEMFPKNRSDVERAEQGFPDQSGENAKSVADQVIVVEAWRLPSSKDAGDGMHVIACSSGIIFEEEWTKDKFPFAFMHYGPRLMGFWAQGLAEQLLGTQVEINKLLATITSAINLVGVPRVFLEDGSKVVSAHINNMIGAIVKYRGTKPIYEVAPCVPQELYGQLERLVQYAYQQSGVSALAATSQKPAGLNSGEAIRNYDDLQSDRFAALAKRYDNFYVDLSYLVIDQAKEIAERDKKYQTVYPKKNGVKEIDLPNIERLDDPFVIQCYDASSLPRDPAGRLQKITEMIQGGMISISEGRRLLDFPDLEQEEKLANSGEERILKILDEIVEKGKYTPPDPFMDLQLATQLCTQYYNLYAAAKLEESKCQLLRDFFTQIQNMVASANPPPPSTAPGGAPIPQANAEPLPQSPLVPNANQAAA